MISQELMLTQDRIQQLTINSFEGSYDKLGRLLVQSPLQILIICFGKRRAHENEFIFEVFTVLTRSR